MCGGRDRKEDHKSERDRKMRRRRKKNRRTVDRNKDE